MSDRKEFRCDRCGRLLMQHDVERGQIWKRCPKCSKMNYLSVGVKVDGPERPEPSGPSRPGIT